MIEYIDDMIKATSGEDICLLAKAVDAYGDNLEGCYFCLFDNDDNKLFMIQGFLNEDNVFEFYIPEIATEGMKGKFWYSVTDENDISLCFKSPIYFV